MLRMIRNVLTPDKFQQGISVSKSYFPSFFRCVGMDVSLSVDDNYFHPLFQIYYPPSVHSYLSSNIWKSQSLVTPRPNNYGTHYKPLLM